MREYPTAPHRSPHTAPWSAGRVRVVELPSGPGPPRSKVQLPQPPSEGLGSWVAALRASPLLAPASSVRWRVQATLLSDGTHQNPEYFDSASAFPAKWGCRGLGGGQFSGYRMVRCTRQRSVDLVTSPGDLETYGIADCKLIQAPIPGKKKSCPKVFSTKKQEKLLRGALFVFCTLLDSVCLVKTETICGEFRTN